MCTKNNTYLSSTHVFTVFTYIHMWRSCLAWISCMVRKTLSYEPVTQPLAPCWVESLVQNMGVRIKGTLGDLDPLNKVPCKRARYRVQKGTL